VANKPCCLPSRVFRRDARVCASLVENSTSAAAKPDVNGDGAPEDTGIVYMCSLVLRSAQDVYVLCSCVVCFQQHRQSAEPEPEFEDAYTIPTLSLEQVCTIYGNQLLYASGLGAQLCAVLH
jgi:hypothetical protein